MVVRPEFLAPPSTETPDREALLAYFLAGWRATEWLFSSVSNPTDLSAQPDPLRNPLIFYLGHPAAFFVNKLHAAGLLPDVVDPVLAQRFAVGVDPHTTDDLEVAVVWPSLERLAAFRARAFDAVVGVIKALPCTGPIGWDDPAWSLFMGLEHERIHFETSSVLLRQLDVTKLQRPTGWVYAPTETQAPDFQTAHVDATSVTLGRSATSPYYGWDNEFGQRPAQVAPFEAARYLVSNADWLSFVRAGGYDDRALWSTEALQWRDGAAHHGPKFWVADATRPDGYAYRAMFDLLDLPLAWPAEVNAHEAAAYCRWRGEDWRLPTEAEHRALVGDCGDPCRVEVGQHRNLNLNMALGSPSAVDAHPDDAGICHAVGNVWQWLSEPMRPFDGFRPHPLYDDFTAPYFDDHHALMTGGAWASTGTSCSPWYRNWFRKHFYQHVGFRIVRSLEK